MRFALPPNFCFTIFGNQNFYPNLKFCKPLNGWTTVPFRKCDDWLRTQIDNNSRFMDWYELFLDSERKKTRKSYYLKTMAIMIMFRNESHSWDDCFFRTSGHLSDNGDSMSNASSRERTKKTEKTTPLSFQHFTSWQHQLANLFTSLQPICSWLNKTRNNRSIICREITDSLIVVEIINREKRLVMFLHSP